MLVPNASRAAAGATNAFTVEVDTLSDSEWDLTLAEFNDGHYEQAACTTERLANAKASHLVLRDQHDTVVAGARLAIYALPGLGRGLALLRFGPLWRRRGEPVDPDIYRAAIAALVAEYCDRRGHNLVVRPRPNPDFYAMESEMLGELGFAVRRALPAPDRYCANVSMDEDAQLANFDIKWRYNLRQAQKKKFDIRFAESEEEIAAFRELHDAMTERKSLDSAARGMIDCLEDLTQLPDPIRMRVVLARHQGRIIAGSTIGILGDTGFNVLGATNEEARKLKTGYALQWWMMRWLNSQGVRWYELGGTGDPGIRTFKKGLIGKAGVILETQEYDRWTKTSARLATDAIYAIRNARSFVSNLRRS